MIFIKNKCYEDENTLKSCKQWVLHFSPFQLRLENISIYRINTQKKKYTNQISGKKTVLGFSHTRNEIRGRKQSLENIICAISI